MQPTNPQRLNDKTSNADIINKKLKSKEFFL